MASFTRPVSWDVQAGHCVETHAAAIPALINMKDAAIELMKEQMEQKDQSEANPPEGAASEP